MILFSYRISEFSTERMEYRWRSTTIRYPASLHSNASRISVGRFAFGLSKIGSRKILLAISESEIETQRTSVRNSHSTSQTSWLGLYIEYLSPKVKCIFLICRRRWSDVLNFFVVCRCRCILGVLTNQGCLQLYSHTINRSKWTLCGDISELWKQHCMKTWFSERGDDFDGFMDAYKCMHITSEWRCNCERSFKRLRAH